MKRRKFVAATALVATAAAGPPDEKPAIDGGTAVRSTPLRAGYWGSQCYDKKERAELLSGLCMDQ